MMTSFRSLVVSAVCVVAILSPTLVSAQASPSAYTSAVRYDELGRTVGTIAPDPDGNGPLRHAAARTTYDMRGNPIRIETGELASWQSQAVLPKNWSGFTVLSVAETTYDSLNRKLIERVKGSNGITVSLTQYSYDNRGRLECTAVRMNPSRFNNLPASACTLGVEGPSGPDRISRTVYDAANQVLQMRRAVGTPIEIADVTYSYTPSGQIAQVIDANGNRAELRYDGHDRQTRWVFPSKTRPSSFNASSPAAALSSAGSLNNTDYEAYTYDDNGNRLSLRKRDGSTLTYQYDALDRMTRKTVPSRSGLSSTHTRDVFYSYDLQGRPVRTRFDSLNGVGQTNTYDTLGRLAYTSDNASGALRNLTYQYDRNGNRTRITYPDNQHFNYQFDGMNRLQNVTLSNESWFALHQYNSRGSLERMGSGGWSDYDYDPAGRLDEISINLAGTTRDVTWSYTRNPASQITSETQSNDAYSWNGHVNVSRNYITNGLNQYQSAGGSNFTYDANGNLTSDGSSNYQYDVENRLVRVTFNGYTAHLYYDPLGRLYRTTSNQPGFGQINYLYDGNALVAEYASNGTMLNRYVHGSNVEADDPIAWFTGSTVSSSNGRFAKSDPRGSIVSWTNWSGTSLITNTYDEYGINGSNNQGRFQYTGQAWVPEIGMYYYKARIYSPTLGRFLQTDPIGYEDQVNLYAYVGNDPINLNDPSGEQAEVVLGGAAGDYATPDPTDLSPHKAVGWGIALAAACAVDADCREAVANGIERGVEIVTEQFTTLPSTEVGPEVSPNKIPGDAHDPDGAKAPGKPGEAEDFPGDPARGETWQPGTRGQRGGWVDSNGNVWRPSGPAGHGGPHWDVTDGDGNSTGGNVYPGGRTRPHANRRDDAELRN